MSWISRLFSLPPDPEFDGRPLEELTAHLAEHARPSVRLVDDARGRCQLGGEPALPPDVEWPRKDGRPLSFLASIELECPEFRALDWLPRAGRLLFFYDGQEMPWGMDPADAGSWLVLHVTADAQPRAAPEDLARGQRFGPRPCAVLRETTLPSWEHHAVVALDMTERESDAYIEHASSEANRVGGHPSPVQSDDMERDCEAMRIRLGADRRRMSRAELRAGERDWRLLLQLRSDGEWMWGDAGLLYFWVREEDARRGDFSAVWLILQCA